MICFIWNGNVKFLLRLNWQSKRKINYHKRTKEQRWVKYKENSNLITNESYSAILMQRASLYADAGQCNWFPSNNKTVMYKNKKQKQQKRNSFKPGDAAPLTIYRKFSHSVFCLCKCCAKCCLYINISLFFYYYFNYVKGLYPQALPHYVQQFRINWCDGLVAKSVHFHHLKLSYSASTNKIKISKWNSSLLLLYWQLWLVHLWVLI